MATGLDDPSYVDKGTDYGPVRRPLRSSKALDDALLAWGDERSRKLLPDHGFPLRLVVPGWVGIASIKWLGSLEVSTLAADLALEHEVVPDDRRRLARGQPAARRPTRCAAPGSSPRARCSHVADGRVLHGRSWSGAGPIRKVEVSVDGTSVDPGRSWM